MKNTPSLVLWFVLFLAGASGQTPPLPRTTTIQDLFDAGKAAFFRDDFATTKRLLTAVNKADPKHQPTVIMLRNIALAEKAEAAKRNSLEGRMQRMVIPQLDLQEARVTEVLDFLQLKAAELSAGGAKPNFIVKLDEAAARQSITLKLTQVSVSDALRALATTAGLEISYDQFAVTIRSKTAAATAATPPGK